MLKLNNCKKFKKKCSCCNQLKLTNQFRKQKDCKDGFRNKCKECCKTHIYTCQVTGKRGGNLNCHHLNSYHWDKEHRTDINNGITISEEIHKLFHKTYGYKNNTKEQFEEFKQRYINKEFKEAI